MINKCIFKNISFSILFCIILSGCAALPKPEKTALPEIKPVSFNISDVNIDRKTFNQVKREIVTISYRISKPAKAIIKIFDPDMHLVRELLQKNEGGSELNHVIWNGKDMEGNIVPDEAYFFTIESMDYSGNFIYYDPTTISGGEFLIPESLNYNREKGIISYRLARDARVKIRAGITRGPLLKNILNWTPVLSGAHEIAWDGKDVTGAIDSSVSQKGYRLSTEAISLPENSIITYGNKAYDYFEYKNDISWDRPEKEERPLFKSKLTMLGIQLGAPDKRGPEPKFRIDLPKNVKKTDDGIYIVKGKTQVKLHLDDKIKRYVTEQRYEIIFFVDFKFIAEAEEGHSPFTLVWDTRDISNGEHIITVNVATLNNQVSSASMRVVVQN